MDKGKKQLIEVIALVWIMGIAVIGLDYFSATGLFNQRAERLHFFCAEHNYTQMEMEPMTRYICHENQTCFAWNDGKGGGLFIVLTECLRSMAMKANQTVECNGTVEDCEEMYFQKYGGI